MTHADLSRADRLEANRRLVDGFVRDCVVSPTSLPPHPSPEAVVALTEILEEFDRLKRREISATNLASKAAGLAAAARPLAVGPTLRAQLDDVLDDARIFLGTDAPR